MGIATTLGIASLVVAAGSAYESNKNQQQAVKQQKKAAATSAAENTAQQQSQIRDQVRQQRIRTAQIMQQSADTGTLASSGELGGISSLASQIDSNIGNLNRSNYSSNAIIGNQNQAATDQSQASTWGSVGQIASSSFNIFSSTPQFKKTTAKLFS